MKFPLPLPATASLLASALICDAGQGTQDLGFRAELPVFFDVRPAVAVKLAVRDHDGTATTTSMRRVARITLRQPRASIRRTCFAR